MLTALGIDWPSDWRHDAGAYLLYRDLMRHFQSEFDFINLIDVDWFVYGWGRWQMERPAMSEYKPLEGKPLEAFIEITKSGQQWQPLLVPIGPLFAGDTR